MEIDITYLAKLYPNNGYEYKYLLCVIDHFSKFSKEYLLKSNEVKEVLKCLKIYIKEYGKPTIIQSDNGGEFTANIIKDFLKEKEIIF